MTYRHLHRLIYELEQAIWRGREARTGSQMHAGAWAAAEKVCREFGEHVDPFMSARSLVNAAAERALRRG